MTEYHLVLTDSAGKEIARRTLRLADDPGALRAEAYRARRMVEELYRDATYAAGLWEKYAPVRSGDFEFLGTVRSGIATGADSEDRDISGARAT